MSNQLLPDLFERHLGTDFSIEVDDDTVVVAVLDSVQRHPPRSHGERTEPFSLVFLGPSGTPLPQRIYTMTHPQMGNVAIFLVPIGPDQSGRQRYEAVFN